ncbi:MAG: sulfite exporter TauE/SafE family protein [Deltaproteobacteria bacterium]|nr:sulfite exporter TauE/SafE family protein [Deltaproteobacteria bacterium]
MNTGYLLALSTGLLGGFGHCIGMCGPLVGAFAFRREEGGGTGSGGFIPQLLYHGGRLATYAGVGALMGLTGSFLNVAGKLTGLQNAVDLFAGLFVLFMGVGILRGSGLYRWFEKKNQYILAAAGKTATRSFLLRFFFLGALFGLLPCGLSYSMFMAAAATGNPVSGAFIMFAFGAGTLPSLLVFGVLVGHVGQRLRGWAYRAGGVMVILMGILFLWRGFHVSPCM